MAWPRGVPKLKHKDGRAMTARESMAASGMITDLDDLDFDFDSIGLKTIDSSELDDEEEKINAIEDMPEWGIGVDKRCYTVYRREKYKEDFSVIRRVNGENTKVEYKAGEWSEWKSANGNNQGPFCSTLQSAFIWIHRRNIKEKIVEMGVVKDLAKIIDDSEKRIMKVIKV